MSTRKCVKLVAGLCTVPFSNQSHHQLSAESMNYTWALPPLREVKTCLCVWSSLTPSQMRVWGNPPSCPLCYCCCCVLFAQVDRLWDPPLLRPQYDGPRGPAHCHVPHGLLHHGWHRFGNLPGSLPRGGVDGSTRRAAHLHDHNSLGLPAAAGFTQLWVIPQKYRKIFNCLWSLVSLSPAKLPVLKLHLVYEAYSVKTNSTFTADLQTTGLWIQTEEDKSNFSFSAAFILMPKMTNRHILSAPAVSVTSISARVGGKLNSNFIPIFLHGWYPASLVL